MEYIIVGDTEKFEGCLVTVCRGGKEQAEAVLARMLTNPTENDKVLTNGHTNLRIETVEDKNCWWNDPVLRN